MRFFRFKKKEPEAPVEQPMEPIVHIGRPKKPVKGEKWWFDDEDESPWPRKKSGNPAVILDVKDGWVRYRLGSLFTDKRMKLNIFLKLFEYKG